jgi:hypothetical protein
MKQCPAYPLEGGPNNLEFFRATKAIEDIRTRAVRVAVGQPALQQRIEMLRIEIEAISRLTDEEFATYVSQSDESQAQELTGPDHVPAIELAEATANTVISEEFGAIEEYRVGYISAGYVSLHYLPLPTTAEVPVHLLSFYASGVNREPLKVHKHRQEYDLAPDESPEMPLDGTEAAIAHLVLARLIEATPRIEAILGEGNQ